MDLNPQYLSALDQFLQFRNIPTDEVIADDIADYLKKMKVEGRRPNTIKKHYAALKSCLKDEAKAIDWSVADKLPVTMTDGMSKVTRKVDPLRPDIHLEVIRRLCPDNLTGHRDEAMFSMASAWAIGRGVVEIWSNTIERHERGFVWKSNIMPIQTKGFEAVRRVMADRGVRAGDEKPLFVEIRKGQRPQSIALTGQTFSELTTKYAELAGFKGRFTADSWPIGSITYMMECGVPLPLIMRWTGLTAKAIGDLVQPSGETIHPQDLIA